MTESVKLQNCQKGANSICHNTCKQTKSGQRGDMAYMVMKEKKYLSKIGLLCLTAKISKEGRKHVYMTLTLINVKKDKKHVF